MPARDVRRSRFTPNSVIAGLLPFECLFWLSQRYGWFGVNGHKGLIVLATLAYVVISLYAILIWFLLAGISRWRFQYSIRTLLLLFVVVAVPCGWLASEMQKAAGQRRTVAEINRLYGACFYGNECDAKGIPTTNVSAGARIRGYRFSPTPFTPILARQPPPEPSGPFKSLGIDFFQDIVAVDLSGQYDLKRSPQLHWCSPEEVDAVLMRLESLPHLRRLNFEYENLTGPMLEHLARLHQLKWLHLAVVPSDADRAKLQKALPGCKIDAQTPVIF